MDNTVNGPTIAGLPNTKANPAYSKDTFKQFIPDFADWVDSEDGKIETIINELQLPTIINSDTKLVFNTTLKSNDKKVLDIDINNDVILGKITGTCYKKGYNIFSEVIIDNPGASMDISVSYYVDGDLVLSIPVELNALGLTEFIIDEDIPNSTLFSVLTVHIETDLLIDITQFKNTVKSNFKAPNGDAFALYEAFCNIADQKIIKTIWNSDWEYAMSLCIAHYIATVNRETQRSFGLDAIAKDSGPRGLVTVDIDKKRVEYKNIMLTRAESMFWQSTEYGRILTTLLSTKAVLTMIVVN